MSHSLELENMGEYKQLEVADRSYLHVPVQGFDGLARLPFSLRVLLENLLRQVADGRSSPGELQALAERRIGAGLTFYPARVFLQDLLGVPVLVDLAALRDAVASAGGDPRSVNPKVPADLVIDHSLRVDVSATPEARQTNLALEYERNAERFSFLRWCQRSFDQLRVVPPGKGIMHQINLEHLAKVVWIDETPAGIVAYPDTLVGTDSHSTMINGLGVLGWGVGGIEAEAVMLGKPVSLPVPEVVGVEVSGNLPEGTTPTDLVLTITEKLRALGVVGKFVEFFGPGLDALQVATRGTIANMAPEYGATCVFFPLDWRARDYLRLTGRPEEQVQLVEAYARAQGLWRDEATTAPEFDQIVTLDLASIRPSIAGPWNPEDRIDLGKAATAFCEHHEKLSGRPVSDRKMPVDGASFELTDGAIVIAAITSCTNTSNPFNMIAAGLLARNAVAKGLTVKPWVKTSLAPGSQVVAAVLERTGLQTSLDALGFHVVGFGCTTCNGMSGPIPKPMAEAIEAGKLVAAAVLSGNRNFEGRIHPNVRAAYLASPALVIAHALAGAMTADISTGPLGMGDDGLPVTLKDIWPDTEEIVAIIDSAYGPDLFRSKYADLFDGDETWEKLGGEAGDRFAWDPASTYVRCPPYFDLLSRDIPAVGPVAGMRPLAVLGDSITTDHLSPSGAIVAGSPAARFLTDRGVKPADFNSYGTRRGNHEVAVRATFANIRLRNKIVPGVEGAMTRLLPDGTDLPIFDAALEYGRRGVPLVIVAGRNYGCGSSRDWAAKGVALLGVRAVIAESFERIHRTNLIGMGILPLVFPSETTADGLAIDGTETFDLPDLATELGVRASITCVINRADGNRTTITLTLRIETEDELAWWRHGGILPFVWRDQVAEISKEAP
ncbi:aconitate hydratase [Skermanella aerolata]|uniref:aconitate hydratase AcnA n=1 Tax=Skermanella aerolata TaxID=393310 RepID=UPI003D22D146